MGGVHQVGRGGALGCIGIRLEGFLCLVDLIGQDLGPKVLEVGASLILLKLGIIDGSCLPVL